MSYFYLAFRKWFATARNIFWTFFFLAFTLQNVFSSRSFNAKVRLSDFLANLAVQNGAFKDMCWVTKSFHHGYMLHRTRQYTVMCGLDLWVFDLSKDLLQACWSAQDVSFISSLHFVSFDAATQIQILPSLVEFCFVPNIVIEMSSVII